MKFFRIIYNLFIWCFILFLVFNCGLYLYCYITPKLSINKVNGYYLYDSNDNLIFDDNEDWIALEKISHHLINATVYTEDKNYSKHLGFDYFRIFKAVITNLKSKLTENEKRITANAAKDFAKTSPDAKKVITGSGKLATRNEIIELQKALAEFLKNTGTVISKVTNENLKIALPR